MSTIPESMRALPQWVLWKEVTRNGRATKVPIQVDGNLARTNDPSTWAAFEALQDRGQLGFVFAAGGGLFGVDIDVCISDDGEVTPWAVEILERFPSYREISPSGKGIKIFCRGTIDKGRKVKLGSPVGGRQPGIEVYGEGRYFAVTGRTDGAFGELEDCSEGLIWLVGKYWPEKPAAASFAAPVARVQPPQTILERARAYLREVEPAISGCGGHGQTFHAAGVLVHDFALTPEQAFPLLLEWNERCQPPWSEKDLFRKLTEVDKRPGERGRLIREEFPTHSPEEWGVDLSGLLGGGSPAEVVEVEPEPEEQPGEDLEGVKFPFWVLDGLEGTLIGEIIRYDLDTAWKPQPILALAGALSMMSVLTGRKIKDRSGTRTNLYILGLGKSGEGKGSVLRSAKKLMFGAGADKHHGSERIGSAQGIMAQLAAEPALLYLLDEVGFLIESMKEKGSHMNSVTHLLLSLYGAVDGWYRPDAVVDISRSTPVDRPHLVIYGAATIEGFWPKLTAEHVQEGFLGRFLVFESPGGVDARLPSQVVEIDPPQSLLDWVRAWATMSDVSKGNLGSIHPQMHIFGKTREASDRLDQHAKLIDEKKKSEKNFRAAIWARAYEKTAKLALIFAASRQHGPPWTDISLDDANRAIAISNYSARLAIRRASEHVSYNQTEAAVKKVYQAIGTSCLSYELTRRTRSLTSRERDQALQTLLEGGEIGKTQHQSPRGGKPAWCYRRLKALQQE